MAPRPQAAPPPPTTAAGPSRRLKVCLINPATLTAPRSLSFFGAALPLGLAYVAASVREAGHDLTVVDATGEALGRFSTRRTSVTPLQEQGLTIPEIVERLPPDADVVGFSNMFTHQWPYLRELAAAARARLPGALLVAGGENATAFWREMLGSCAALDACVLGEGEGTFLRLLEAAASGSGLEAVPSLAFRRGGSPARSGAGSRLGDLDALPWPAWDLFPVDAYLEHGCKSGVDRGRSIPLLTSRGCPFQCTFCSSPAMWTTRYVRRSPQDVVREIAAYVARYGISNADVNDLTALLTKEWILEFCGLLEKEGLGISWQLPSGTRSEAIDREAAERLYASGCRNFTYAPESGSEATLRRVKKKVRLPSLLASHRAAVGAGLVTNANVMIGFPHEGAADLWRTYLLVLRLAVEGMSSLTVLVFTPYPGSELYEGLLREGRIRVDEGYLLGSLLRSGRTQRSYHPRLSGPQLVFLQLFYICSFYAVQYLFRPGRFLRLCRNFLRGRQDSVVDQFFAVKGRQAVRAFRRVAAAAGPVLPARWEGPRAP